MNEWTGQRVLKPEAVSDELTIADLSVVDVTRSIFAGAMATRPEFTVFATCGNWAKGSEATDL